MQIGFAFQGHNGLFSLATCQIQQPGHWTSFSVTLAEVALLDPVVGHINAHHIALMVQSVRLSFILR